ncbi:hypothetical protein [Bradyrhizobium sp. USDA 4506]
MRTDLISWINREVSRTIDLVILDHEPHRRPLALEDLTSTCILLSADCRHWLARRGASPVPVEEIEPDHAKPAFSG